MAMDYVGKIQALLNKAEHPNTPPAEAEAAAAMAAKLMKAKGIEEAQIRSSKGQDPEEITLMVMEMPIEHGTVYYEAVYPLIVAMGGEALADTHKGEMTIVGTSSLLDSLTVLLTSLSLQMNSAFNAAGDKREAELRKLHPGWDDQQVWDAVDQWCWDYIRGWGAGVAEKIRARVGELADEAPGNALVLQTEADRIRAAYRKMFPHTVKLTGARKQHYLATAQGRQDGRNADIGDARVDGGGKATRAIG
ncbi:DUF2786 domain-containing protein [Actinomadura violacea]|uniref:DUF2786 domain-containing protein n=1 Tax=Actinomadura violacea TaxID=2819934 RepID=A0ABS3RXH4_9ACTN|nr:DUF2786 domain-containing protein [Actinomadura violacea]MBO2461163.1 DUF2786 domain-containing protein [Actinomadura violacea]